MDELGRRYRTLLAELSERVMALLTQLYADTIDGDDLDASFEAFMPRAAVLLRAGQARATSLATAYLSALVMLGAGRRADFRAADVDIVGTTAAGLPLIEGMAAWSAMVKGRIGAGAALPEALDYGRYLVERFGDNELTGAVHRQTEAITTRTREFAGWNRILTPPSCSLCQSNEGFHTLDQPFVRHGGCVTGETLVSVLPPSLPVQSHDGGAIQVAMRRWYRGQLILIRTASGQFLRITPNHPVLTDSGWVPAGFLNEGDNVVRSGWGESRVLGGVAPDEDDVPARIQQIFRSWSMDGLVAMPTTAEDFHGDGLDGQVDVVAPYRLLWPRVESSVSQPVLKEAFAVGLGSSHPFHEDRPFRSLPFGGFPASRSGMRRGSLSASFLGRHVGSPIQARRLSATGRNPSRQEDAADVISAQTMGEAQREFGFASNVGLSNRLAGVVREVDTPRRFDPPSSHVTAEGRDSYAELGRDLLERLTGLVETDRIVDYSRVEWAGHVYNLRTREGWYAAAGVIVSNCDCYREYVPAA